MSSVTKTTENARSRKPSAGASDRRKRRSFPFSIVCLRCLLTTRKFSLSGPCMLSELQRLLARTVLRAIGLISPNNPLHKRMTNDVFLIEINERNSLDTRNDISRFDQPRHFSDREVNLRNVARDDSLAAISDACEKHLHLLSRGVLSFIENDKCIVQGSSAHKRNRCNFDHSTLDITIHAFHVEHVVERVVER